MKKHTVLTLSCFFAISMAMPLMAQVGFTARVTSVSGNCNSIGGKVTVAAAKAVCERPGEVSFPDCNECERARLEWISGHSVYQYDGCMVRISTTPCAPCDRSNANGISILGPQQGSSFYSTNPTNEVADWVNDDIERQLALNKNYLNGKENSEYSKAKDGLRNNGSWFLDTDNPFVSTNMRQGGFSETNSEDFSMKSKYDQSTDFSFLANQANVNRYVNVSTRLAAPYLANPQDLTSLLHKEFKVVSGFDLDAIMRKLPSERTEAEKQALYDYQEWRKQVTDLMIEDINKHMADIERSEEYKTFEMAILSENCYGDSKNEYIGQTNYQEIHASFLKENDPMRILAEIIDECNKTKMETGFSADLYYNEMTNEYTIAFEGSNFQFIEAIKDLFSSSKSTFKDVFNDWVITNFPQGTGEVPTQFFLAALIGSNIPDGVKVNITGHSLGGGLASLAGAISGKPTYTFNAEGVNQNIIDQFGLKEKIDAKDYNIKAFQANNDLLTSAQEGALKPITVAAAIYIMPELIIKGNIASGAVGEKKEVDSGGWHSIEPMIKYFQNQNGELPGKIYQYKKSKQEIYNKGHGVERQTQETMMIITGD